MKENKEKKSNENIKWFIEVFIITFILSLFFSYISTTAINDIPMIPAIIILLAVILFGIIFDIVGLGAKTAVKLIRNSSIVANICADVIGDICGVLSGAISAIIAMKITESYNVSFPIQFLISALVAALTVGGKALGKGFAKQKSGGIVWVVSRIIKPFFHEKKEY